MQAFAAAIVLQDNGTLIADVHSIMFAQWIIAICILIVLLALIGAALAAYLAVRGLQAKVDKLSKEAQAKATPLIAQGQDILGKVQGIIADLKPKIASVTTDVTHMTGVVKGEVDHITGIVKEQADHINGVVREQTDHINHVVREQTDHISGIVREQTDHISGIVNAKSDEIGATVSKINSTVQDVNAKSQAQVERVNGLVNDALKTTEQVSKTIQDGIKTPVMKIAEWVETAKTSMEGVSDKLSFLQDVKRKPEPSASPKAAGGPPPAPVSSVDKPKF